MKHLLNRMGNDQDVKNTIDCCYDSITTADLEAAIADETATNKRTTRLKLLERTLKKKLKEATI